MCKNRLKCRLFVDEILEKNCGTGSSPDPTSKWEWSKLFSIYTVSCRTFKMSASEYLRCAPKYNISRLNNQDFSAEGAQPPPQTPSSAGRGTPPPRTLPPRHLRRLASRAFGARPPLKNPGYAPVPGPHSVLRPQTHTIATAKQSYVCTKI